MATMTRRPLTGWRTRNGLKFKIKRAARRQTATYAWIIFKQRQSAGRGERENARTDARRPDDDSLRRLTADRRHPYGRCSTASVCLSCLEYLRIKRILRNSIRRGVRA